MNVMGESIPAKRHGKCRMCNTENTVITKHNEYLLDRKNGVKIDLCDKCRRHYNTYFTYLKNNHNYKGRIR